LPAGTPAPPFAVDPPEIFAAVRHSAPDAVIQVNHPWDPGYGYFRRAVLNERTGSHWRKQFSFDFDLVEVVNGYELGHVDVLGKNLRRFFDLLDLGRRYTAVGSSDSHKLTNEWAGYPRTYVRVADDRPGRATAEEISRSLRSGHALVTLGPFIEAHIGEAGPGDTVEISSDTVPLDVTVRAADWVDVSHLDLVAGGDVVDSFDLGAPDPGTGFKWARTIDVPVPYDTFIVLIARGERPIDEVMPGRHVVPFAFTNPIWVNAGRPREAKRPARSLHARKGARSEATETAPAVGLGESPEPSDSGVFVLPADGGAPLPPRPREAGVTRD
jgi:hypothetical protein